MHNSNFHSAVYHLTELLKEKLKQKLNFVIQLITGMKPKTISVKNMQ